MIRLSAVAGLSLALLLNGSVGLAQPPSPDAAAAVPQTRLIQGQNFTYLLPAQWRLAEEGNHALVLQAQDLSAAVIVYGVSGFAQDLDPARFAHDVITNHLRLSPNAQVSNPTPVRPLPGYTAAAILDINYSRDGPQGPKRIVGLALSNVVSVYGRSDAVMTLALALDTAWPSLRSWLPQLALQAVNTGPNPFGRTSVSGNIQRDGVRRREAYGQYLEWSQANWAGVVAQRAASADRQAQDRGETLTGQYWGRNPYTGTQERFSTTPSVIWVHRDGRQAPSADPSFDPRTPTDPDWRRVVR